MTSRRFFSLTFCLLFMPAAALAQPNAPKAATGKRAKEFIAAFNKGDAKTLAGFWTAEGTMTDLSGKELKGRAAIEKHFAAAFAGRKNSKITIAIHSSRQVTPDVVLEEGVTEVFSDGNPPSVAQFAAVLVKKNGDWYFDSVRELPAQPPSHAKYFEEVEWILGQWSGETAKGETFTASYEFAENGNFIVSSFAISIKGAVLVGGTQWIAWDPVDKQIRSWTFYSGGGFGESVWTKDGDKWSMETKAKTADGKKVSVTNVLTKVDADNITWQATKLVVDGTAMPALSVVKLKRVVAAK